MDLSEEYEKEYCVCIYTVYLYKYRYISAQVLLFIGRNYIQFFLVIFIYIYIYIYIYTDVGQNNWNPEDFTLIFQYFNTKNIELNFIVRFYIDCRLVYLST